MMFLKRRGYTFICIIAVYFIISACANQSDYSDIRVNGEMIYESEIQNVLNRYNNRSEFVQLSKEDVAKSAIKEVLVLQERVKLKVEVDDRALDDKVEDLKNLGQSFYDLAIKQYGNEASYREALRLRMIYEGVKEKIISDYLKENPVDIELVKAQMVKEGLIKDKNEYDKDENRDLRDQFTHSYIQKVGNNHFNEWVQSLVGKAEIEYVYK